MALDRACSVPGCGRPVFRRGLCSGHLKRSQRGQPVDAPLGSLAWDQLHEAILAYQRAESDEEHELQLAHLAELMRRWVHSGGCCGAQSTAGRKMVREQG